MRQIWLDGVVPILQERGLFRAEYTESTLRGHYGLPRPENQFTVGRAFARFATQR